jgi:hypothetical protein
VFQTYSAEGSLIGLSYSSILVVWRTCVELDVSSCSARGTPLGPRGNSFLSELEGELKTNSSHFVQFGEPNSLLLQLLRNCDSILLLRNRAKRRKNVILGFRP